MSEEYIFEYPGTKQMFLDYIKQFPGNDNDFYYFDRYIIKFTGDEMHFGIEGAHSGGYWFIPQITEYENKTEFRGSVQYIRNSFANEEIKCKKSVKYVMGNILGCFLFCLVLIITFPIFIIEWLKGKRKIKQQKSVEDQLFDLLENHLGCTRKLTE